MIFSKFHDQTRKTWTIRSEEYNQYCPFSVTIILPRRSNIYEIYTENENGYAIAGDPNGYSSFHDANIEAMEIFQAHLLPK